MSRSRKFQETLRWRGALPLLPDPGQQGIAIAAPHGDRRHTTTAQPGLMIGQGEINARLPLLAECQRTSLMRTRIVRRSGRQPGTITCIVLQHLITDATEDRFVPEIAECLVHAAPMLAAPQRAAHQGKAPGCHMAEHIQGHAVPAQQKRRFDQHQRTEKIRSPYGRDECHKSSQRMADSDDALFLHTRIGFQARDQIIGEVRPAAQRCRIRRRLP